MCLTLFRFVAAVRRRRSDVKCRGIVRGVGRGQMLGSTTLAQCPLTDRLPVDAGRFLAIECSTSRCRAALRKRSYGAPPAKAKTVKPGRQTLRPMLSRQPSIGIRAEAATSLSTVDREKVFSWSKLLSETAFAGATKAAIAARAETVSSTRANRLEPEAASEDQEVGVRHPHSAAEP